MAPRKRKAARSVVGRSKAVPLAELMGIGKVRELVEREVAAGFTAPKSVTCRIGKRQLAWSIRFRRKTEEGTHVHVHRFLCPNLGVGD